MLVVVELFLAVYNGFGMIEYSSIMRWPHCCEIHHNEYPVDINPHQSRVTVDFVVVVVLLRLLQFGGGPSAC